MRVIRFVIMFEVGRVVYRGSITGRIYEQLVLVYVKDGRVDISGFGVMENLLVEDVPEYVMEVIRGRISDPFFVIDVRKRIEKLNVLELEFIDEVCL